MPVPTVEEIMQRDVISVPQAMPVAAVAELLTRNHISGAPVVDAAGRPVGVVSLFDLAARRPQLVAQVPRPDDRYSSEGSGRGPVDEGAGKGFYWEMTDDRNVTGDYLAGFYDDDEPEADTAASIMTRTVHAVAAETSLPALIEDMLRLRIHRMLVTSGDSLVGIVSTTDVMRAVPGLLKAAVPA